jgi:hypothetical protein
MIPFDKLLSDGELKNYLEEATVNPWKGTYFENYPYLNNKRKGMFGEKLVAKYMPYLNCSVRNRKTSGQDFIIDGYKTEVKISLAHAGKKNRFALNHISFKKDWERLIFVGINVDLPTSRIVFFSKKDLLQHYQTSESPIIKHQQGGKKIKNDDYLMIGNFDSVFELDFVHDISEWKNEKRGIEFWLN